MSLRHDANFVAVELHHITVADLAAATRFNLAIDAHGSMFNELFCLNAVLGEIGEFEQLPKPNRFVANKDVIRVRSAHE